MELRDGLYRGTESEIIDHVIGIIKNMEHEPNIIYTEAYILEYLEEYKNGKIN